MHCKVFSSAIVLLSFVLLIPGQTFPIDNASPKDVIQLSDSERAWIAEHPVVNVRVSRNYPPFEFYDEDLFKGIAVDYLSLIAERVGLKFQPTPDMPWKEALSRIERKDGVDLILLITHTPERESVMSFTRDYISFPEVIFTRKDKLFVSGLGDLEARTIATENDFIAASDLRRDVPRVKLLETETTEEALQAVALGEADAYVGNLAVGSYLIEKLGFVDLKIAASADYDDDSYAMAVRNDWPQLLSILEKGLESMSAEDHQRLKQKWFVIRYEHGLSTTDILFWVFLVVLIASVILLQLQRVSAKKLRQSEAYFRTITQTSPDTIALVRSSDGVVLDVNDVGLETFGFSREEIPQAASTVQLNLWQDLKQRERFLGQLNENGKVDNFEASFLTRAGRQFAGLVSARVIEYQGDPCHLAFIKDVSEIKAASLALQTSEAKYRKLSQEFEAVLDGIVDSLVLLDTELKAVWGNRGAALQFGLSPAEIIGKTCHQLWTCGDTALCDDCVRRVFLSGEPFESIRSTTDARTWGVKGYPVFDRTGKVTNVIQIASDLTEKIQLREEATRASHLAALGSLSAGIAHEINNPTGLVLISLPFVRDAMLDLLPVMDNYVKDYPSLKVAGLPYATFRGEIMQTLEDMQNGAQRVKRIVEDLKDFSCEKSRGDDELVDLEDVVAKSLRLLQNIIKSKTDRFVCNLAKDLPKVRGSAQRLEQVLVNLVQNACLALTSREESVVLTVSADNARQKVVLEVKDEGCGISEDLISKITDPFFTTRREEGGTGLGLSVSARIIEEHGGTLNIISEPGKGSVFTMTLPIADGDEE